MTNHGPADIDITDTTVWDDQTLAVFSGDIARELERRRQIASIPTQIRSLAYDYTQGGGDPSNLTLDPLEPVEEADPAPIVPDLLLDSASE